jgi:hypothetical protein
MQGEDAFVSVHASIIAAGGRWPRGVPRGQRKPNVDLILCQRLLAYAARAFKPKAAACTDAMPNTTRRTDATPLIAVVATLLLHAGLLALLRQTPQIAAPLATSPSAPAERLRVILLESAQAEAEIGPPRPSRRQPKTRPLRAPQGFDVLSDDIEVDTLSIGTDRGMVLSLPPSLRELPELAPRNPMMAPRAGMLERQEAFVEGITLRQEITPELVVNAIGAMFFGGGGDPCIDIRSRLASARGHDERMALIHRERARRCR